MRATRSLLFLGLLALGAVGCDGGGGGADGGVPCSNDLDCDDTFDCTIDTCGVSGTCRWDAIDERCGDGLVCAVGRGCVSDASCSTDAECDDGFDCTLDACGVGGICTNRPLDERCTAPEVCTTTAGCAEPEGCDSDAECDDSIACTNDSCGADRSCRNTPLDELCTGADEVCSPVVGCFVPMPCDTAAECQDGDFCNGEEICEPEFGCQPAEAPRVCDDSDDCTIDSCSNDANRCVFACDTTRTECGCAPDATCNGAFNLPGAMGSCLGGFINWNFTNVTFTNDSGVIEVTGWTVSSTSAAPPMADPGPACPEVDASTTIPGDCTETYRIMGTFTDDNTFEGTFSVTFSGSCFDCTTRSVPVTGSRVGT